MIYSSPILSTSNFSLEIVYNYKSMNWARQFLKSQIYLKNKDNSFTV